MSRTTGGSDETFPTSSDLDSRRSEIAKRVLPRFLNEGGVWILSDEAGVGKTTTTAAELPQLPEIESGVLFACERHEKGVEEKFNDYHHAKGRSQPYADDCIEGECDCDEGECDLMCPVFERDESDPVRQKFVQVESLLSHREAHRRVDGVDSSACHYSEKRDERSEQDYVVGVHQHLHHDDFNDRVAVIDETPSIDTFQEKWRGDDLTQAAKVLRRIPDADWLADWVDRLQGEVAGFDPSKDDDVELDIEPPERDVSAEHLAKLKVDFNDFVINSSLTRWGERLEPCFDAILAALADAGFEPEACRAAIGWWDTLEHCPACSEAIIDHSKLCENTGCQWTPSLDDETDSLPRVTAHLDSDKNGPKLAFTEIPAVADLPDDVLILDATPRREIVSALFGVPKDEIVVEGSPYTGDYMLDVTEIGNGAYHGAYLKGDDSIQEKIQRVIDYADSEHDHVLYVSKKTVKGEFEFPQEGNIIRHYGALRGMDVNEEWDDRSNVAVCLIGAQHFDSRKQKKVVEALGKSVPDDTDLEAGEDEKRTFWVDGEEVTREPKAFPGLLGEFFKNSREDELVQAVHRLRPILRNKEPEQYTEPISVYKINDVPTRMAVDERLTWGEFMPHNNALEALYKPIREEYDGAVELSTNDFQVISGKSQSTVSRWVRNGEKLGILEKVDSAGDEPNRYRVNVDRIR